MPVKKPAAKASKAKPKPVLMRFSCVNCDRVVQGEREKAEALILRHVLATNACTAQAYRLKVVQSA